METAENPGRTFSGCMEQRRYYSTVCYLVVVEGPDVGPAPVPAGHQQLTRVVVLLNKTNHTVKKTTIFYVLTFRACSNNVHT